MAEPPCRAQPLRDPCRASPSHDGCRVLLLRRHGHRPRVCTALCMWRGCGAGTDRVRERVREIAPDGNMASDDLPPRYAIRLETYAAGIASPGAGCGRGSRCPAEPL